MFVTTPTHLITVDALTGTYLGESRFVWLPAGGPGSLYWIPIRANFNSSSSHRVASGAVAYDDVALFYYDQQSFPVTVNPPTYHPFASFSMLATPQSHTGAPVAQWNTTYNAYVHFQNKAYYRTYHVGDPAFAANWYVVYINSTQFPYTNTGYSIQVLTGDVAWSFEMDNTTAALWSTFSFALVDNDAQVIIASTEAGRPYSAAAYSTVDGHFLWRNDSLSSNDFTLYKVSLTNSQQCGGTGTVPFCFVGAGVYPPYDLCVFDTLTGDTVFCFDNSVFQNDACWYSQKQLAGARSGEMIIFQGNTSMWAYSMVTSPAWNASVQWTLNFTAFMLNRNENYTSIYFTNPLQPTEGKNKGFLFVPAYAFEGAPVWSSINLILVVDIRTGNVVSFREFGPYNPTMIGVNEAGDVLVSVQYCTKNPYGTCLAISSSVVVV